MTAKNRHHCYETEQIRIDITTRESVFVNGELNPVPLKFYAVHKAALVDYVHYRCDVSDKFSNVIQLNSVIKIRLCVHSVKKEETHY